MSSESRTEETKPVAGGVDLRLRVMNRLSNPTRNSLWVLLSVGGAMLAGLVFYLYQALAFNVWQFYVLAGMALIAAFVALRSVAQARPVAFPLDPQAVDDVLENRLREGVRLLEDHPDLPSQVYNVICRVIYVAAVHFHARRSFAWSLITRWTTLLGSRSSCTQWAW